MKHGDALSQVLARASMLLNEVAVRNLQTVFPAGAVSDVLPPVAGG